jgi:hypothetical protein
MAEDVKLVADTDDDRLPEAKFLEAAKTILRSAATIHHRTSFIARELSRPPEQSFLQAGEDPWKKLLGQVREYVLAFGQSMDEISAISSSSLPINFRDVATSLSALSQVLGDVVSAVRTPEGPLEYVQLRAMKKLVDRVDPLRERLFQLENSIEEAVTAVPPSWSSLSNRADKETPAMDTHHDSMDVLISWSQPQSRRIATAVHALLSKVVPNVKPWMSTKDIAKGKEWFRELQGLLGRAQLCVICVTKENVRSPWLYYEAGAIGVKFSDPIRICPYLVGVAPGILSGGPLAQWQCTVADRDDTFSMIRSLNEVLNPDNDDGSALQTIFNQFWPELETVIMEAESMAGTGTESNATDTAASVLSSLIAEAKRILLGCSAGQYGALCTREAMGGGLVVQTDGGQLYDGSDGWQKSLWQEAVSQLERLKLIRRMDRERFKLTPEGWHTGDMIRFENFENREALATLSRPARELLMEASKDKNQAILYAETLQSTSIATNGREFSATGQMRDYTVYKEGMRELQKLGLIHDQGKGIVFEMTEKGDSVANVLTFR